MNARRKLTLVVAGAIAALAVGSLATAAIPDGGGVVHGCYDKQSGQLRVTDTATNQPKGCSNKEAALTWNQQGPQGVPGPQGPKGASGLSRAYILRHQGLVSVGTDTTLFGILPNPGLGDGFVSAKLLIGTLNSGFDVVSCTLYSGPDQVDSSSATVYSAPGSFAWTTLYLVGRATGPNVVLRCSADNGFAKEIVITATGVDAITDVS